MDEKTQPIQTIKQLVLGWLLRSEQPQLAVEKTKLFPKQKPLGIFQWFTWLLNIAMIWKIALLEIIWLVVLTILKNMKVNGKDYPIYFIYYGKEKMFGTTNQLCMMILPFKNDDSQRPKATSLEMLVSDWKFSLPSLVAWLLWMDCFEGTPTLNRESVVFTTIRKKKKVFLQFFLQFFPSTETLLRPEEISCEYMF